MDGLGVADVIPALPTPLEYRLQPFLSVQTAGGGYSLRLAADRGGRWSWWLNRFTLVVGDELDRGAAADPPPPPAAVLASWAAQPR